MKKSKIIRLVLITASLSSYGKYNCNAQSVIPFDNTPMGRQDTTGYQKPQELNINIVDDILKVWERSFGYREQYYSPFYYQPWHRRSRIFHSPAGVRVARGGFGTSASSIGA